MPKYAFYLRGPHDEAFHWLLKHFNCTEGTMSAKIRCLILKTYYEETGKAPQPLK